MIRPNKEAIERLQAEKSEYQEKLRKLDDSLIAYRDSKIRIDPDEIELRRTQHYLMNALVGIVGNRIDRLETLQGQGFTDPFDNCK